MRTELPVPGLALITDGVGALVAHSLAVPRVRDRFTDEFITDWLNSHGVNVVLPELDEDEDDKEYHPGQDHEYGGGHGDFPDGYRDEYYDSHPESPDDYYRDDEMPPHEPEKMEI